MGKLTYLFAFALIVLQGSNGTSFKISRNEIEDLLGQFFDAIYDVNQVIEFIGDNVSTIPRDYDNKIYEIVDEKSSVPEIEDLRESIRKIESEVTEDPKQCIGSAWIIARDLPEDVEREVDICVSGATTTGEETQGIIKSLDGKAADLRFRIINGMHNCMTVGVDNAKCLRELIPVLNQELVDIKKEVEDIQSNVQKITEDGIESLKKCLDQSKDDLNLKTKFILDELKQCLNN